MSFGGLRGINGMQPGRNAPEKIPLGITTQRVSMPAISGGGFQGVQPLSRPGEDRWQANSAGGALMVYGSSHMLCIPPFIAPIRVDAP